MRKLPQFNPRHPPPAPDNIMAARFSAGLTIPEAVTLCAVSAASWEKWESGKPRMPIPVWILFNLLTERMK